MHRGMRAYFGVTDVLNLDWGGGWRRYTYLSKLIKLDT